MGSEVRQPPQNKAGVLGGDDPPGEAEHQYVFVSRPSARYVKG